VTTELKPSPPSILIVDDDPSSTKLLETCLKKLGCQTAVASNGDLAVKKITSEPYDLVVLDWKMPDMTGGEALLKAEKINSTSLSTSYQWSALRMPVITYSGCPRSEIELPECEHFRFLNHWTKATPFSQLMSQTKQAMSQIGVRPVELEYFEY